MTEPVPPTPPPPPPKCPVCSARFRDRTACPRCGTDLTAMMRLAARAWAARQRCRAALVAGDLDAALRWAAAANRLRSDAGQ